MEVKYGLPKEIKYCTKCNMSNQQPMSSNEYKHSDKSGKETMSFDENGVCYACNFGYLLKENGSCQMQFCDELFCLECGVSKSNPCLKCVHPYYVLEGKCELSCLENYEP